MASINKPGGGITITFAPKNDDVRKILVKYKEQNMVLTDYICDAIRFYEKNKMQYSNNKDNIEIKELIKAEIDKALKNISLTDLNQIQKVKVNENIVDLEDDINNDFINTDED